MALSLFEKAVIEDSAREKAAREKAALEDARKTPKGKGGGAATKAAAADLKSGAGTPKNVTPNTAIIKSGTGGGGGMIVRPESGMIVRPASGMIVRPESGMIVRPESVIPRLGGGGGGMRNVTPVAAAVASQVAPNLVGKALLAQAGYNASKLYTDEGREAAINETENTFDRALQRDADIERNAPPEGQRNFGDKAKVFAQKGASLFGTAVDLGLRAVRDPAGVASTLPNAMGGDLAERASAADDMATAQIKGKQEYYQRMKDLGQRAAPVGRTARAKQAAEDQRYDRENSTREAAEDEKLRSITEYLSQTQKAADDQRYDRENSTREAAKEEVPMRAIPVDEANDLFMKATGTPFDPKSALDRKRMASLTSFLQSRPDLADASDTKKSLAYYTSLANNKRKF